MGLYIECLPPPYARELRRSLNLHDKADVADEHVINFLEDHPDSLTRVEDAKMSAVMYAERANEIFRYKRRATKKEIKAGLADKNGMVKDPAAGLRALVYTDRYEMYKGAALENRMQAVMNRSHGILGRMMVKYSPKKLGMIRDRAAQDEFVRAHYGDQHVSHEIAQISKLWNEHLDELLERINATGRVELKNFKGLPLNEDTRMVKKAGGFTQWINSFKDDLDLRAMGVDDSRLLSYLNDYYEDIRTGGLHSLHKYPDETMTSFQREYNRQNKLIFKNASGWLKYQKAYSLETPYASMMDQVNMLSKNIALREMFGPSPAATFAKLKNQVVHMTKDRNSGDFAENAFEQLSGALSPKSQEWAEIAQQSRNVMTGAKLTGAFLSAAPDVSFGIQTSIYNGLPVMRGIKDYFKAFFTVGGVADEDRLLLARMGFNLLDMSDNLRSMARWGDAMGKDWSAKWAEGVMRASLLNHFTIAGKISFVKNMSAELAAGNYSKRFKLMLERYGVTAEDIQIMQQSKMLVNDGVKYVDMLALPRKVSERMVAMIVAEGRYATPEPDAAVRAAMNQGTRRGTVHGEMLRNAGQFKGFTGTIIGTHIVRSMRGFEGSVGSRMAYAGGLLASTTILGTASMQAKELAKGRKPRDWDSPQLWYDGMLAGGALSIAGDVIFTDVDKYGQSVVDFLAGPLAGDINKIFWNGLIGSGQDIAIAEKTLEKVVREFGTGATRYIPGQFWYWRLAWDRMALDGLRHWMDPGLKRKEVDREIKRLQRSDTNEQWWRGY